MEDKPLSIPSADRLWNYHTLAPCAPEGLGAGAPQTPPLFLRIPGAPEGLLRTPRHALNETPAAEGTPLLVHNHGQVVVVGRGPHPFRVGIACSKRHFPLALSGAT
jgi:hypothetical protein